MELTLTQHPREHLVSVTAGKVNLEGNLVIPEGATGIVLFAHGSGSSRHSPRNRYVAGVLQQAGLATLLIDLLTLEEEEIDLRTRHLRFDIGLLASRLVGATDWLVHNLDTRHLKVGYFGASTGAGAALIAAAERLEVVQAIVFRGGQPDLAGSVLTHVKAPTLLIVGGYDMPVIAMNEDVLEQLRSLSVERDPSLKRLEIIPEATHLFEEPGTLAAAAAQLASEWFTHYLK
ncbi:dienelactone hydrolase family protein [Nostoc sp. ATCC 53789]|uniref:dienelactone hydrolase family protein n=1 Tax=Nostoc sp. ATCC 53789 TaxID=76335 RepID=UPI000DECCFAB|nr:dienelactone hydrolase family protein [Nostoc sp. ATCC 53789]QHG20362.1 alpha/beta hydrolase [Nostoc sp. ATCC 53789]RCJ33239.1 hydrolase [Nostoc sp. ATCC 53789]